MEHLRNEARELARLFHESFQSEEAYLAWDKRAREFSVKVAREICCVGSDQSDLAKEEAARRMVAGSLTWWAWVNAVLKNSNSEGDIDDTLSNVWRMLLAKKETAL